MHIYGEKIGKLHWGLKYIYKFYLLVTKTIFYSFATLNHKILFSSIKDKIHIFVPPYNILSLSI